MIDHIAAAIIGTFFTALMIAFALIALGVLAMIVGLLARGTAAVVFVIRDWRTARIPDRGQL